MLASVRRSALVALVSLLVVPSVASAQREPGGGYDDYESLGCSSERIVVKSGRCDSRRPAPEVFSTPSAPRAGAPVQLRAASAGRGLTFAWDLDDDGAFDDATGATVSRSFPAGNPRVRVRATDDDGRTGETTTTLHVHATNLAPTGALSFNRSNPRVGQPVTVSGYAYDDGRSGAPAGTRRRRQRRLRGQPGVHRRRGCRARARGDVPERGCPHRPAAHHGRRRRHDRGDRVGRRPRAEPGAGRLAHGQPVGSARRPRRSASARSARTRTARSPGSDFDLDGNGSYETAGALGRLGRRQRSRPPAAAWSACA